MPAELESSFIVRILLEARDNASAQVAGLRAEVARLQAEAAGQRATGDLSRGMDDVAVAAERATQKEEAHRQSVRQSATVNKAAADVHRDVGRAMSEREQIAQRLTNAEKDAARATQDGSRAQADLKARTEELVSTYHNFDAAVRKGGVSVDEQRRSYSALSAELKTLARNLGPVGDEFQRVSALAEQAGRHAKIGFGVDQGTLRDTQALAQHVSEVEQAYSRFDRRVKTGALSTGEVRRGYQDFGRDLNSISRAFESGSREAEKFGVMSEQAGKKAKNAAYEATGGIVGNLRGGNIGGVLEGLSARFDDVGIKIVSLSAQLRGLILAGAVGFAQQLDTAVVSLAGGLFSVASAAVEAGAALGGAFVSGIAQALPVVTVLLAAIERIKTVFSAAQLSSQVAQQQAMDPTHAQQVGLENANQMASAQNSLADSYLTLYNAQEQVRQSQIALTQARIDAIRNITDLTMAERDAALAQAGAHLTLEQAQQQVQRDIQTGVTGVAFQQAQLQVQQAEQGLTRADIQRPRAVSDAARARARGVEGSQSVIGAERAVQQANESVLRARQQIEQARRSEQIATLRAQSPSFGLTGPQAQLDYLKSQMSGAERVLFNALTDIQKQLRSPNSPLRKISDAIIGPIADAFQQLDKIFKNPELMKSLTGLANAIGRGLGSIERFMLGKGGQSFFNQMADEATKNAPVVFSILRQLMTLFEEIAKAAAPLLHGILEGINRSLGDLASKFSDSGAGAQRITGFDRLEAFFQRAGGYLHDIHMFIDAFGRLLGALSGQGGATSGGQMLTDMTNALDRMSTWVNTHGSEVRKFFDEARQGVELIGRFIGTFGSVMLQIFNLDNMKAFTTFLDQILLPGLRDVLTAIGFVVTHVIEFFNLFGAPGRVALEAIGVFIAGILLISKIYTPIRTAISLVRALGFAIETFKITGSFGAAVDVFMGYMRTMKTGAVEATTAVEGLTAAEADAAAAGVGAGAVGGAAAGATGAVEGAVGGGLLARLAPRLLKGGAVGAGAILVSQLLGSTVGGSTGKSISSIGTAAGVGAGIGTAFEPGFGTAVGAGVGAGVDTIRQLFFDSPKKSGSDSSALKTAAADVRNLNDAMKSGDWSKAKAIADAIAHTQYNVNSDKQKQIQDYIKSLHDVGGALSKINYAMEVSSQATKRFGDRFDGLTQSIAGSFDQISTSSAILPQVQQLVDSNMKRIASDMGTGSAQGRAAIETNFGGAIAEIRGAMHAGLVSTQKGSEDIVKQLNRALKLLGAKPLSVSNLVLAAGPDAISAGQLGGALGGAYSYSNSSAGSNATGGWIPATQGGAPYRVGEGGYKEMVLTTDPRHADRQRDLLDSYFKSAPHMAPGGMVRNSGPGYTFPLPDFASEGRVDRGQDMEARHGYATTVAIGDAVVVGAGLGFPGMQIRLTDGPLAGQVAFYAHNSRVQARVGQQVHPGDPLGATGGAPFAGATHTEIGFMPGYGSQSGHWVGPGSAGGMMMHALLHQLAPGRIGVIPGGGWPAGTHALPSLRGLTALPGMAGAAQIIARLKAPHAGGSGIEQVLAQHALNHITSAANAYLSGQGGSQAVTGTMGPTPVVAGRWNVSQLARLWDSVGGPRAIDTLMGRIAYFGESGGDPNAYNPSGATGFWQILGQLVPGNLKNPRINALNAVAKWKQQGLIAWLGDKIFNSEIAGKRPTGPGQYAAGGMVSAPWGGRPVPIIAHEGERVSNPSQWHAIARLAGTTSGGLDSYLGYNGSPKQSFADGGAPKIIGRHGMAESDIPILPDFTSINPDLASVMRIFSAIAHGFRQLHQVSQTSSHFSDTFIGYIDELTNATTGLIPLMAQQFATYQAKVAHRVAQATYSRISDPFAPSGGRLGRGRAGVGINDPLAVDAVSIGGIQDQGVYLQNEEKTLRAALPQVRRQLAVAQSKLKRNPSAAGKALVNRLLGQYQNLVNAQHDLASQIDSNNAALYQAEQQKIQDQLGAIGNFYGTQQAKLQNNAQGTGQQQLQTLGNFLELGRPGGADQKMTQSLRGQLAALAPVLAHARAIGDKDMVAQIEQQMAQLQGTITSSVVQQITDAQQYVEQRAGTFQSGQQRDQTFAGIAAANDDFTGAGRITAANLAASLDPSKEGSLAWQRSGLSSLRDQAAAVGDVGLVASLTQSIDSLDGQIATNTQALKDNTSQTVAQTTTFIQGRSQFTTGIFGGLAGIVNTIGQITGYTDIGALKSLATASNTTLTGANQQLIGGANGLDTFLGSLGLGASGLSGLSGMGLVNAISGMNIPSIESHMDASQIATFEGLLGAIVSNSAAIETNNQQLATLNGQLNQPQQWSSTAWSAFRVAIFNGMGGLLPQYSSVLPASAVPNTPIYSQATPSVNVPPTIGNLSLTHPVEQLDPQVFGEQLAYELATQ